jgi:O-antigen chain-terminating methyltransferase
MPSSDLDRLAHERAEADRRYNEALTALDRAVVRPVDVAVPPPVPEPSAAALAPLADVTSGFPPRLSRWKGGKFVSSLWKHLAPVFERQQAFNGRVAREIAAAEERDRAVQRAVDAGTVALRDHFAALGRFDTALMMFLQQITAFVEAKDRELAASVDARLGGQAVEAMADLRAQVAVLQRATQMLKRELESRPAPSPEPRAPSPESRAPSPEPRAPSPESRASIPEPPATSHQPPATDAYKYVAFEDQFRGSDEEIREKLRAYVPVFAGASDVLDVGCGRGEFLALLKVEGISARGVDANHEMAASARERGLDVEEGEALAYLSSRPDGSLGGLMASQVVEHLEPAYLMRLLETAHHKLRPGAPIVIETINPACWLAFFSSYIRDFTHVRPVHPETLQYLLRASGFGGVSIRYSAPVPEHMKMKPVALPAEALVAADPASRAVAGVAHAVNANAAILNSLLFSYLDYAAIGYRS